MFVTLEQDVKTQFNNRNTSRYVSTTSSITHSVYYYSWPFPIVTGTAVTAHRSGNSSGARCASDNGQCTRQANNMHILYLNVFTYLLRAPPARVFVMLHMRGARVRGASTQYHFFAVLEMYPTQ